MARRGEAEVTAEELAYRARLARLGLWPSEAPEAGGRERRGADGTPNPTGGDGRAGD